jgi:hypothetical protein
MFDYSKFDEIGQDIYVYKNFLDESVCQTLLQNVKDIEEDKWILVSEHGRYLSIPGSVDFKILNDKISKDIGLKEEYYVNEISRALKITEGGFMGPHADNIEYDNVIKQAKEYVDGEPYDLRQNSHYGIVFYFNDFEGGELEYPKQKIIYKPNSGDLVIHSAKEHCTHGVKKVLGGVRYSYANNIFNFIKIKKGVIPFPGLGKATYVSETMPLNAKSKETWFQPQTGNGYIYMDGYWTEVPR